MSLRLVALAVLMLLGACTLLTTFNPEGQPCDTNAADPSGQCLRDFHCENGKCVRGAFHSDAGDQKDGG